MRGNWDTKGGWGRGRGSPQGWCWGGGGREGGGGGGGGGKKTSLGRVLECFGVKKGGEQYGVEGWKKANQKKPTGGVVKSDKKNSGKPKHKLRNSGGTVRVVWQAVLVGGGGLRGRRTRKGGEAIWDKSTG